MIVVTPFLSFIFVKSITIFKMIQVLILSSLKFIVAPPLSLGYGFNFLQTFMTTTAGGLIGIIFFFYLSEGILILWKRIWPFIKSFFVKKHLIHLHEEAKHKKENNKPSFTWKSRMIINVKRKWGLIGIATLTPILLSIPLGTFLANRYYKNKRNILIYLSVSVTCWSLLMSSLYFLIK